MNIDPVFTNMAPEPGGHYSQAIKFNGMIFVSGQLPLVPGSTKIIDGTIEEETLQVLKNVGAILHAAGSEISKIVKVTIFISDIKLWSKVNKAYSDFFGSHKPARSVVPVKELHHGSGIEMEVIASQ
jgi:2-iminobutanoate/2-iminopropanoate deaminase